MTILGVRSEPHLCDTIPGDSKSAHITIFIQRILTDVLASDFDTLYDAENIKVVALRLQQIVEHKPLRDADACRDAFASAELIRRILQDGMTDSRDTSIRGYSDDRDSIFADGMRSQIPPGLVRAGGGSDGNEEGDGGMGGDAGGDPAGGGEEGREDSDDEEGHDEVAERNNQVVEPEDFKEYPCLFKDILGTSCDEEQIEEGFEPWRRHILSHFGPDGPPPYALCLFCNAEFENAERPEICWAKYLIHTFECHIRNSADIFELMPDYRTLRFMLDKDILSHDRYSYICELARSGHNHSWLRLAHWVPPEMRGERRREEELREARNNAIILIESPCRRRPRVSHCH